MAYRLLFAPLTYFSWNRWYLLGSVGGSLVLPLLSFPGLAYLLATPAVDNGPLLLQLTWARPAAVTASTALSAPSLSVWAWVLGGMVAVYMAGVLYRLQNFGRNLWWLRQLARRHPRTNKGAYWLVELSNPTMPAFSFGRSVFLSPLHASLSATEQQQLLQHELVHVHQRHTLDILLLEGIAVLLWFNPAVYYVRQQLKEVHEYLADAAVARAAGSVSDYGQLLIKLAAQQSPLSLVHAFSTKHIIQRITMLTTPSSRPTQKLRFLLIVPILAGAWMATSCADSPSPTAAVAPETSAAATSTPIGRITWEGNTVVSTERLNQALGLKPGDAFDSLALEKHLSFSPDGKDVTSLYMDQGYLFFSVSPVVQHQPNGSVDLTFKIAEGRAAQLDIITFTGNGKTSTESLMDAIPLRPGATFSRAKLIEAQKNLALLGPFDPERVNINPQPIMRPNAATDLVRIEFSLVEKK
ncbi:POTRA domain-containing protein [Hymenobacter sp. YC55]|uniref:POTRA domain-containing protein n=1 Tax=Hymenobacter sp. YC55 TaxID=3034019 RepID=UPI0023F7A10C|nr:POTRA domain-containing protein [Hymenobacter sp. YC55]